MKQLFDLPILPLKFIFIYLWLYICSRDDLYIDRLLIDRDLTILNLVTSLRLFVVLACDGTLARPSFLSTLFIGVIECVEIILSELNFILSGVLRNTFAFILLLFKFIIVFQQGCLWFFVFIIFFWR